MINHLYFLFNLDSLSPQFFLSAVPGHLSPIVQSAAVRYIRPISQGQQAFTPDASEFPVGQPLTKLTAKLQVGIWRVYMQTLF